MSPSLHTFSLSAMLSLTMTASLLAQATTNTGARSQPGIREVPTPARERVEADLDAWWQSAVFYEIFVRSFADSTRGPLANDGIGDLNGIIERLDYLNDGNPNTTTDLGVTGLWLMPITQSPSYHGYDTTDYYSVDPEYGTNSDFQRLVEEAHGRGIRIIVDLVLNHASSDHEWFKASLDQRSKYRDWFVWSDAEPGFKGPWNQDVWHPSPRDDSWYYGIFWKGMPDLNYQHEPVTERMFDVIRFWSQDLGADGFRLDAIRHLIEDGAQQENTRGTHAWLHRFYEHCKATDPNMLTVGEVWADSDAVSRYVGDQMDLAFEFALSSAIVDAARDSSKTRVIEQMDTIERLYPPGMYATFLRNHDQTRTITELGGAQYKVKVAAAIQFLLPGVPFVYYGEEIGMEGSKPDPDLRTPMQWSGAPHAGFSTVAPWKKPKSNYPAVNVRAQERHPDSLWTLYRRLIALRRDHAALRTGAFTQVQSDQPDVLAFLRTHEDESLLCIVNLGGRRVMRYELSYPDSIDLTTTRPFHEALHDLSLRSLGGVRDNMSRPIESLQPYTSYVIRLHTP